MNTSTSEYKLVSIFSTTFLLPDTSNKKISINQNNMIYNIQ